MMNICMLALGPFYEQFLLSFMEGKARKKTMADKVIFASFFVLLYCLLFSF